MKKSLHPRTIPTFFAVAVAVLLWISTTSYWSTHQMVQSFDAVSQAHQALDKIQHIELLMESAESSVRAYTITGDAARLAPYQYAKLVVPYEMKQVDEFMATYPQKQATWQRLNKLVANHLTYLRRMVALRRSEGFAAAARGIRGQDDAAKRNTMDRLLSEFQQEERIQLDDRRRRASRHSLRTKSVLVLAGFMSLGFLAWAFGLLRRETHERRQAESTSQVTETFLHSIVDRIPYMILVKEAANLRLTLVNRAAEEWLGRSRKDLLGSNDLDLRTPEEARGAIAKDRQTLRGGTLADIPEEPLILPGKKDRVLHTQKISVPDDQGNPAYLLTISEDITQRKQAERMLELSRDAAVESARLKSEFIRNMSHEIRTPLSVVSGMTELLLGTELSPEQRKFATMVYKSAEGLSHLSKSILDFSRIEAGAFSLEIRDLDVRRVVEEVASMLGAQAKAKGVNLVSVIAGEIPALVRGDPIRLRQVLTHLIGNAVKFTEHGEIIVRVSESHRTDTQTWVHIRISDTGIGIPEEVQAHLFEAFRQGDGSRTRRFGGTGLGLAISRRILELMGGEIGFESRAGQGSTFWLTVPLTRSPMEGGVPTEEASAPWVRSRVLVVDENETVRQLIQQQLRSWALTSEAVSSGAAALELLRREAKAGRPYPIVLLDMQLPDMDGVVFARLCKQDTALSPTQIIVMTGEESRPDPEAAAALGFSGWISTPPKLEGLHARLAALINPYKPLDPTKLS